MMDWKQLTIPRYIAKLSRLAIVAVLNLIKVFAITIIPEQRIRTMFVTVNPAL